MSEVNTDRVDALLDEVSANVLTKARRAFARGLVRNDGTYPNVWWVSSLRVEQAKEYRVSTDWTPDGHQLTWITCTCTHGQKSGGGASRCYHVAAALLSITREGQG